jgi:hypothetical protein
MIFRRNEFRIPIPHAGSGVKIREAHLTSGKNGGYSVPPDFSILAAIASPELGGRPWKHLSQGENSAC